nr:hypothetical protein [Tanacetum cinerariifolium]
MVIEMKQSSVKDLEVNGSGATDSVTLSQLNDLLINQVGAVGTESDTSISEDMKRRVLEMIMKWKSAEKDLEVNRSGEDINETNAGKDSEVNISVAANDFAISHSDDIFPTTMYLYLRAMTSSSLFLLHLQSLRTNLQVLQSRGCKGCKIMDSAIG